MFINKHTNDLTIQGTQESGIPEIPGIVMRFSFSVSGYLRNLGLS